MNKSVTVELRRSGDGWTCEVEVQLDGRRSRYTVTVTPQDVARWGRDADSNADEAEVVADLVRRSFEFLLEREPPESILRRFDLAVIQRYFPEYDRQFQSRRSD
jgi:hypothetical protein